MAQMNKCVSAWPNITLMQSESAIFFPFALLECLATHGAKRKAIRPELSSFVQSSAEDLFQVFRQSSSSVHLCLPCSSVAQSLPKAERRENIASAQWLRKIELALNDLEIRTHNFSTHDAKRTNTQRLFQKYELQLLQQNCNCNCGTPCDMKQVTIAY